MNLPSNHTQTTGPVVHGLALAVLFILVSTHFVVFSSLSGIVSGRDAEFHVTSFLASFGQDQEQTSAVARFHQSQGPNYGPALRLWTLPFWTLIGTRPGAFIAAAFSMFLITIALSHRTLRRLEVEPWTVVLFGILVLSSEIGTRMYLTYNIDCLYALAGLAAFHFMIASGTGCPREWPIFGVVVCFCLFVRLNTLFYLAVPLAFQLALFVGGRVKPYRKPRDTKPLKAGWIWWILLAALAAADLWYYLPKLAGVTSHIRNAPDWHFDPNYGPGNPLLSAANWTWFFRQLPDVMAPGLLLALAPLFVLGLWKMPVSRRAITLVFLLAPMVPYNFIVGTRKPEYIAPSILLFVLIATAGFARLRRACLKWPVMALLLTLASWQFWFNSYGMPPIPFYDILEPPNRAAVAWLSPLQRDPEFGNYRGYDLNHRLLDAILPEKASPAVGVLDRYTESPAGHERFVRAALSSVLEDAPSGTRIVGLSGGAESTVDGPDALLVADRNPGKDPDRLPTELRGRFREILTLTLFQNLFVHVYLPSG